MANDKHVYHSGDLKVLGLKAVHVLGTNRREDDPLYLPGELIVLLETEDGGTIPVPIVRAHKE